MFSIKTHKGRHVMCVLSVSVLRCSSCRSHTRLIQLRLFGGGATNAWVWGVKLWTENTVTYHCCIYYIPSFLNLQLLRGTSRQRAKCGSVLLLLSLWISAATTVFVDQCYYYCLCGSAAFRVTLNCSRALPCRPTTFCAANSWSIELYKLYRCWSWVPLYTLFIIQ